MMKSVVFNFLLFVFLISAFDLNASEGLSPSSQLLEIIPEGHPVHKTLSGILKEGDIEPAYIEGAVYYYKMWSGIGFCSVNEWGGGAPDMVFLRYSHDSKTDSWQWEFTDAFQEFTKDDKLLHHPSLEKPLYETLFQIVLEEQSNRSSADWMRTVLSLEKARIEREASEETLEPKPSESIDFEQLEGFIERILELERTQKCFLTKEEVIKSYFGRPLDSEQEPELLHIVATIFSNSDLWSYTRSPLKEGLTKNNLNQEEAEEFYRLYRKINPNMRERTAEHHKQAIPYLNITRSFDEIKADFEQYGVLIIRPLVGEHLLFGQGNQPLTLAYPSSTIQNHLGALVDTIDPNLLMNASVIGCFGAIENPKFFPQYEKLLTVCEDVCCQSIVDPGMPTFYPRYITEQQLAENMVSFLTRTGSGRGEAGNTADYHKLPLEVGEESVASLIDGAPIAYFVDYSLLLQ